MPDQVSAALLLSDEPDDPVLAVDINEDGKSSAPDHLLAVGESLFFAADNTETGVELWLSLPPYDEDSTRLVADIFPGEGNSNPAGLAAVGDTVFFQAHGTSGGVELWLSEPPYTSARMVTDLNPNGDSNPEWLTGIGEALFFVAEGIGSGREVWKTQPPYNEATLLEDVFSGGASSNPKRLTAHGWTLFFVANDSSGEELFKSVPPYNSASTERVKQINKEGYASPDSLTFIDDTLFFAATDRDGHRELWKSRPPYDEFSTELVDEFDTREYSSGAYDLYAVNSTLFYTAFRPMSGFELRKVESPYTATYMSRVEDTAKGPLSAMPDKKISIGSTLFFLANDGISGTELYKSSPPYDDDNTHLVQDIRPGIAGAQISDLTVAGDTLFFRADDGEFGMELWQSAPPYNEDSTSRVGDIQRGGSSSPTDLTVIQNAVIFAAENSEFGRELWKVGRFYGLPQSGFAPEQLTMLPAQPAAQTYQAMNTMVLAIPELGLEMAIIGVPLGDTGWDTTWLGASAGYLESTAFPTHAGNTVLTAHAVLADGQHGPFHDLEALSWGDRLEIHAWGERYVYEVRSLQVVSPDDASPLAHEELDWLTLITCHDYDPVQEAFASRLVVRAVLVEVVAGIDCDVDYCTLKRGLATPLGRIHPMPNLSPKCSSFGGGICYICFLRVVFRWNFLWCCQWRGKINAYR